LDYPEPEIIAILRAHRNGRRHANTNMFNIHFTHLRSAVQQRATRPICRAWYYPAILAGYPNRQKRSLAGLWAKPAEARSPRLLLARFFMRSKEVRRRASRNENLKGEFPIRRNSHRAGLLKFTAAIS